MKNISNLDMIHWLRKQMNACETEIEYIEELLVTTSGLNKQLIKDLEAEKARLREYTAEWDRYARLEAEKWEPAKKS